MRMSREVGGRQSLIWLLGDSNPAQWETRLATPLDPRHPARHSIWTPVLDTLQDKVYQEAKLRLNTSEIYIRNAVEDSALKPRSNSAIWSTTLNHGVELLSAALRATPPLCVLAFGAFAFEFGRRALSEHPPLAHSHWGARTMGEDFRRRVAAFDAKRTNLFPLLHVTIARGKFIESHEYFTGKKGGNYFQYVGVSLADLLLRHARTKDIWIK